MNFEDLQKEITGLTKAEAAKQFEIYKKNLRTDHEERIQDLQCRFALELQKLHEVFNELYPQLFIDDSSP